MRLFDTHAHLNFPDYENDYGEVWKRAKEAGLIGLINVGTDLATSRRGVEISQELGLFSSVGIHPNDAKQYVKDESWQHSIEELIVQKSVVAVGETGFDFFRQAAERPEQENLLEYFLGLAERYDKPVIFHCRDAYKDLIEVLEMHRPVRGVVHAFGGDEQVAKHLLSRGLSLSFTAQVTYSKNAARYATLLPTLPLDRILVETDCPFLPPEGLRGQRNEPRHVDMIVSTIARLIDMSAEAVAEKTTLNALNLFGIKESI